MLSKYVKLNNSAGLHARPAACLMNLSKKFKSNITLQCGERKCDAKSIFSILRCCFKMGEIINMTVEGADELEAMVSLTEFFKLLKD